MPTGQTPFTCDFTLETIFRPLVFGEAGNPTTVSSIHINNTVEETYQITFQLRRANSNSVGILYDFEMNPGHLLQDDTPYYLDEKTTIWAKSNKTTINVTINGYKETIKP